MYVFLLQGPLCNFLALEAMGEEVIESAKAVIIRRRQEELLGEEDRQDRLEKGQQDLARQVRELGEKMDRLLLALAK